MSNAPLRFSPAARRTIILLAVITLFVLGYREIADMKREIAQIDTLRERIAYLEGLLGEKRFIDDAVEVTNPQKEPLTRQGERGEYTNDRDRLSSRKTHSKRTAKTTMDDRSPSSDSHTLSDNKAITKTSGATSSIASTQLKESADTPTQPKWQNRKFDSPRIIDLNTADTTTLMRIPGIGRATAQALVRYRERLGGFHHTGQISECIRWADPSQVATWQELWLTADSSRIIPLAVNRAEFKALLRHPYLEYEQVCALMNLKRKRGAITSLSEIKKLSEFKETDISRLRPYLDFSRP